MGGEKAKMHEVRDRAILSVQRLLEAQGSVFQYTSYNRRKVCTMLLCIPAHLEFDASTLADIAPELRHGTSDRHMLQ